MAGGLTTSVTATTSTRRRGSVTSQPSFSELPSYVVQSIVVGCPKEIKPAEDRVGVTPCAAAEYIANGHTVVVQASCGTGSGFEDAEYERLGCRVLKSAREVYESSHMIVKVKEPLAQEFDLIREGQVVFCYFHFASNQKLTEAMLRKKAVCIAFETVECKDRTLPLLTPMSEIAGRMSIQEGAKFLEKPMGGRGVLLSGVPGVHPARIVILGGGVVGFNAAKMAAGTGAEVVVLDINVQRLRYLDDVLPRNCRTLYCSAENVLNELSTADVVIGAVLIPGARAPKLVTRNHLKLMKKGSLIVDVAIDQGGCCESARMTTHDTPTYVEEGIMHYCVGNMPGAVPVTSTLALGNVTLKYGLELANKGWVKACTENEELAKGLNIVLGHVLCKGVAEGCSLPYTPKETYMKESGDKIEKSMQVLSEGLARITV